MLRALAAILSSGRAHASSPQMLPASVVEHVRKLYTDVNDAVRHGRARVTEFYTDADGYAEQRWTKAEAKEARETAKGSHFIATVYILENVVAKVVIRIDSPSGDWRNTVEYYFYADGRVAFRFESHFTYLGPDIDMKGRAASGPYLIERRRYCDSQGKVVRDTERAFVVSTHREVVATEVQHPDVDSYALVSDLPFARLLRRVPL